MMDESKMDRNMPYTFAVMKDIDIWIVNAKPTEALIKFAEKQGANVIVRGLRAVADFEYEYQMAGMNQQLNDGIETVFLMADVSLQPIASKLVKEIALFGGDIANFVTPAVKEEVVERVQRQGQLGDY